MLPAFFMTQPFHGSPYAENLPATLRAREDLNMANPDCPLLFCVLAMLLGPSVTALSGDSLVTILQPSDVRPRRDSNYNDGKLSGPWLSDLQIHDGLLLLGDGYGGLWYSTDGARWFRGKTTQRGVRRSMQNAPVRSINASDNGTVLATFLGGGPRSALAPPGAPDRQRAPVARSTNGIDWDVRTLPESCGVHFSATDGDGTWIIPGCENRILVSADDGLTWSVRTPGIPATIAAPGYVDGTWVVGTGGLLGSGTDADRGIYYSSDLVTWTQALSFPGAAKRIVNVEGRLILLGVNQLVASSVDGVHWRQHHSAAGAPVLQAAARHPKYGYTLGGEQCILMHSQDLDVWTTTYVGGARCAGEVVGIAMHPDAGRVLATMAEWSK